MIKYFKNKKKEKLAKEKLAQQQNQVNQAENTAIDHNVVDPAPVSSSPEVVAPNDLTSLNSGMTGNETVVHSENSAVDNKSVQGDVSQVKPEPSQSKQKQSEQVQLISEQTTQEVPVYSESQESSENNESGENQESRENNKRQEQKEVTSSEGAKGKNNVLDVKLEKSNKNLGKKMKQLFSFKKKIDEELFEDLETTLLMADVGAMATMDVMEKVRKSIKRRNLSDADAVYDALKVQLGELAAKVEQPLVINAEKQPFVILVVGVNGVGKTTTIAKLAKKYKSDGKKVMLAAGDTFRAAAVEQLKTWGRREDIPVMAQNTGADSASVIFDAMTSAKSKGIDVLIADTAGRLHTQANLMQELEKISRVIKKNDGTAPHETLIVVDGGTGQNAISQVREFNKAHKLSGIVITKLDGTAKGGVLFNLAAEFGIPVRYIGVGEQSTDLKPYSAKEFVDAIVG